MSTSNEDARPVITFVTGNKKKLEEVRAILESSKDTFPFKLVNRELDLPELQGEPEYVASEKCKLARKEIEGFGVVAQQQGAKSVLATLWQVSDKSTSELMTDLYRRRQNDELTKIEALQALQ